MTAARPIPPAGRPAKRPRAYRPRPSPAARSRILAAVRSLLADPDAGGWTAGYAVPSRQLVDLLAPHLSASTVHGYLSALVRSGDLVRTAIGRYALPERPTSAQKADTYKGAASRGPAGITTPKS